MEDGNINALDITTLELIVFGALTEDGPPVTITIVIKPGGYPNSINPKSEGVIPVAILTTLDFDASIVDANSVRFGPSGAGKAHKNPHLDDVDDDGDTDMVLHFRTQDTGIAEGDTEACLTGMTSDGTEIEGCDFVMVAGK